MKKYMIITLLLALTVLLCACGSSEETLQTVPQNLGTPIQTTEATTEETAQVTEPVTVPDPTEPVTIPDPTEPVTIPDPTEPVIIPDPTEPVIIPDPNNVFFNDGNNFYDNGAVSIRPRHVYWEGDVLVAQCFVVSGVNAPVYNIRVKGLTLSNEQGVIASGSFGTLEGVVLQPYTHVLWTFKFSPDAISQPNGDLTAGLGYESNTAFSH